MCRTVGMLVIFDYIYIYASGLMVPFLCFTWIIRVL